MNPLVDTPASQEMDYAHYEAWSTTLHVYDDIGRRYPIFFFSSQFEYLGRRDSPE